MIRGELWPQPGLVALYHGDNLNDSSGNGHTLEDFGEEMGIPTTFSRGRLGNAFNLGDAQVTFVGSYDSFGVNLGGPASISFLTKITGQPMSTETWGFVWWRSTTGTARDLSVYYRNNSGTYQLGVEAGGTATYVAATLSNANWSLIDVTLGTYATLYLNGAPVVSGSRGTTSVSGNWMYLGIGRIGNAIKGLIDEAQFYNYERSEQQIRRRALYILRGVI